MNRRTLALVAGLCALAVGVGVALVPGLLGLEFDRAVVTALGVVVLILAVPRMLGRQETELDEARTPDPEHRVPTPPPGEDLRDALGEFFMAGRLPYNQAVRGLRAAAVEVLVQYEGLSEAEAERRVEAGTWTDDTTAAAYLAGEDGPDPPAPGLLRRLVGGGVPQHRKVSRTVSAIAEIAGLDAHPDGDAASFPQAGEPSLSAEAFSVRSPGAAGRADGGTGGVADRDGTAGAGDSDGDADAVLRAAAPTNRWKGVGAIALVSIAAGVLSGQPAALLPRSRRPVRSRGGDRSRRRRVRGRPRSCP